MKTYIVTGATRGLGLEIARALAQRPDAHVILVVRDAAKGAAVARELGPQAEARALDVSSLSDIARFVANWKGEVAGLVNNAGIQQVAGTQMTREGIEATLATNHLGAFALTQGLLPYLRDGRVIFIGSGTHNPDNKGATRFGFRGPQWLSIAGLARGETTAKDEAAAGRDRYATSKFFNTVTAFELARRHPETTFLTLDPGLMPGTGLARTAPLPLRIIWSSLLHLVAWFISDASTPAKSASAAVWMLTEPNVRNGECYSFDCRPSQQVWHKAREAETGRRIIDETEAFLRER